MRLTRPALKSSKVSGNKTGLSRGTVVTRPCVRCSYSSGTALSEKAGLTSKTLDDFVHGNK